MPIESLLEKKGFHNQNIRSVWIELIFAETEN